MTAQEMERTDVALLDAQKDHERWLIEHLAREAGIKPEEIDAKAPFSRYGLDSVAAVTMVGDLEQELGIELSPTLPYEYPTPEALAQHLAGLARKG